MLGGLCVREALFLLAHDPEHKGRPRVHMPVLATGLAGATLVDLILARRIHVAGGRVHALAYDPRGVPLEHAEARALVEPVGEPVTDDARALVVGVRRPPRTADLVELLSLDVYARTLTRLVQTGRVKRTQRRLGRPVHQPDPDALINATGGLISATATTGGPDDPYSDALCALAGVLHLHGVLSPGDSAEIQHAAGVATGRLHGLSWPRSGVPEVTDAVRAAVDAIAVKVYG